MLLEGKCHPDVIPILFGGYLTTLVKKSGGIRPIAVGNTWHKPVAQCANSNAMSRLGDYHSILCDYFAPIQLGVGVSGGCESAAHATRRFMESNAFNNLSY